MDATLSISSTSGDDVRTPVPRTQLNRATPPPPGLEVQSHLCSLHGIPVKAAPVRPRSQLAPAFTSLGASLAPTSAPSLQPHVSTTQVGTHTARSSPAHKRSASTAQAGTHSAIGAGSRAGRGPFPKPRPVVLPMVSFGQAKPAGIGHIHTVDSDLMHHQFRLSILHWNPGPARRNPTQIIATTCGRFHAVILQEATTFLTSPTSSLRTLATRTSPSCSTRTPLSPILRFSPFNEASTSTHTRGMVLLIVRGLLRRPSLSGTPPVTFCSVHIHNVVAKKRGASTDLLRRLRGYMHQHIVDFVGGDFNMSAFSSVG